MDRACSCRTGKRKRLCRRRRRAAAESGRSVGRKRAATSVGRSAGCHRLVAGPPGEACRRWRGFHPRGGPERGPAVGGESCAGDFCQASCRGCRQGRREPCVPAGEGRTGVPRTALRRPARRGQERCLAGKHPGRSVARLRSGRGGGWGLAVVVLCRRHADEGTGAQERGRGFCLPDEAFGGHRPDGHVQFCPRGWRAEAGSPSKCCPTTGPACSIRSITRR